MRKIAASLLSADLINLRPQLRAATDAGINRIHLDIMDGHFVPNLSFGPWIIAQIKSFSHIPLEAHLMVDNTSEWIDKFCYCDIIVVHQEASRQHLHRDIMHIQKMGKKAGVALAPGTPANTLADLIPFLDVVVVMTANPGYGGQPLLFQQTKSKIQFLSKEIKERNSHCELEVDGGVNHKNIPPLESFGADVFVVGSGLFRDAEGYSTPEVVRSKVQLCQDGRI